MFYPYGNPQGWLLVPPPLRCSGPEPGAFLVRSCTMAIWARMAACQQSQMESVMKAKATAKQFKYLNGIGVGSGMFMMLVGF